MSSANLYWLIGRKEEWAGRSSALVKLLHEWFVQNSFASDAKFKLVGNASKDVALMLDGVKHPFTAPEMVLLQKIYFLLFGRKISATEIEGLLHYQEPKVLTTSVTRGNFNNINPQLLDIGRASTRSQVTFNSNSKNQLATKIHNETLAHFGIQSPNDVFTMLNDANSMDQASTDSYAKSPRSLKSSLASTTAKFSGKSRSVIAPAQTSAMAGSRGENSHDWEVSPLDLTASGSSAKKVGWRFSKENRNHAASDASNVNSDTSASSKINNGKRSFEKGQDSRGQFDQPSALHKLHQDLLSNNWLYSFVVKVINLFAGRGPFFTKLDEVFLAGGLILRFVLMLLVVKGVDLLFELLKIITK